MSEVLTDQRAPRWMRELARFVPLHSLVLVYGNVLDHVAYPVTAADAGVHWTESDLASFLRRFLKDLAYDVVGVLDPVDGLNFETESMENRYAQIVGDDVQVEEPSLPRQGQTATANSQLRVAVDGIRKALKSQRAASAFVIMHASRLVCHPNHPSRSETDIMISLLKAVQDSTEVVRNDESYRNLLLVVCDKLNDLPAWLYVGNPRARAIHLNRPDTTDRIRFFRSRYPEFHGSSVEDNEPDDDLCGRFSALTDGLSNYEMSNLVTLSRRDRIPAQNIELLCERLKYGLTENAWHKVDKARLDGAEALFKKHVLGQDRAIARVLDLIKRARLGLAAGSKGSAQRPRGVLFFAGPTGVGKTETAKCLARLLFGHMDRLVRFDMSEYGIEHSDQKLMGAPPGYVGYQEGGQLTNQVKLNPFSVLLFDEIEKAHPSVLDKFLQILDDGRLTDGQGETVYFNEAVIIFTSNLGTVAPREGSTVTPTHSFLESSEASSVGLTGRSELLDPEKSYEEISHTILERVREYFNIRLGRPEILNRFGDNIVIFDFVRPTITADIVDSLIENLIEQLAHDHDIELVIESTVRQELVKLAQCNIRHGGRGIRNVIETAVVNPLARWLFDQDITGNSRLRMVEIVDFGDAAPYRYEVTVQRA